jgi:putative membrane protein
MKKNKLISEEKFEFLAERSRQSSVAILLILLRFSRGAVRNLWPVFLVFFFNPGEGKTPAWAQAFIALGFFAAISSIISYFKFYFYLEEDELVIEKGILRKSKLNVPIDRIQTVNFTQGILHQIFNVVSVEIDTAGSQGNEFSINALSKEKAELLREFVQDHKREHPVPIKDYDSEFEESLAAPIQNQELIFRLSPSDLFKIGVSQNHLRTAGIIMAFFYSFLDDIEQALGFDFFKKTEKWVAEGNDWVYYVLLGIPIFIIISFLLTLIRSMLRFYDFKFFKTDRGFKLVSGLFTKNEQSANLQKIQLIRWFVSPIKRLFGMFSVSLAQAASMSVGRRNSIYIPGCYEPHLAAIRRTYWQSEELLDFEEHKISKLICWRQVLYMGILPAVAITILKFLDDGISALLWLSIIPIVYFLSLRYYRNWRYFVSEEGIRTQSGLFTMTYSLLQWYKIQAVDIRQSIYQRRKNVAHLTLYTAAGSVRIPYIELEKAKAIHDFVLYKVESDRRKWM